MQNAVDYQDLGAATSGATFFRSIGGSFGTAVFGAVFANVLTGDLARALHGATLPAGISASSGASPAVLAHLPPAVRTGFIDGYAQALHTVFLVATPVGALAFALSFLLKEVPLRDTTRAVDRADSTAPTVGAVHPGLGAGDGARPDHAVRPGAPGRDLPEPGGRGPGPGQPAGLLAAVPGRGSRPRHRGGAGRSARHRPR